MAVGRLGRTGKVSPVAFFATKLLLWSRLTLSCQFGKVLLLFGREVEASFDRKSNVVFYLSVC